ncbi:FecR domain-containing protein [Orrella sp. JC864]|uniref:FecR domain-containing protein n=1 Tax=Orrella sp. JC864 TaxID=3120298 RepID=UPI0012BB5F32
MPSTSGMARPDRRLLDQAHDWASILGSGQATRQDVEAFRRWRAQGAAHEAAWRQASIAWRKMESVARTFEAEYPAMLPAPGAGTAASVRSSRRRFLGAALSVGGAAAGVVALVHPPLGLWPAWSAWRADYRTAVGEQRQIALAGRVTVSLNTQTRIALRRDGGREDIELLAGEAAVSVPQGQCQVLAGDLRIHMVGADVEVRRLAAGRVRVRCREGAAELSHPGGQARLAAGHEMRYERGSLGVAEPFAADAADWRQGMVVFHDLPLDQAVEEINRYRPGRVVLLNSALAGRRFSASVEIAELDGIIDQLQAIHRITVHRVGDFVFLS